MRDSAPQARSVVKKCAGSFSIRPRASSCHTRSGTSASTSPLCTISRISIQRLRRDAEAEARDEARRAQDAHRVFAECRADVAQHACAQILDAVMRVYQLAVRILRDGIDGEVAPRQILFQRDVTRSMDDEAFVPARGLALGARQRIFLMRLGMQEHREILAYRAVTQRHHVFRRCSHHHPVLILYRQPEQAVAHCAAHVIDLEVRHYCSSGYCSSGTGC